MRRLVLAAMMGCLAAIALGCAAGSTRVPGATGAGPAPSNGVDFAQWEAGWLAELGATDPRIALRLPVKPSAEVLQKLAGQAVVRGEKDLGVVGGAIDLFSFDVRANRLRALREEIGRAPDDGAPATRLERTLLTKLVDAELLRVVSERHASESASELVRGIVATWGRPASAREVAERDELVPRGLLGIVDAAKNGELQGPWALELEDALDPLERLAVPERYPQATNAIADLRVELGKKHLRGALHAKAFDSPLKVKLDVYLGVHDDHDALLARLGDAEAALRIEAKEALAKLPEHTANDTLAIAAAHVNADAACETAEGDSRVRHLSPPPERRFVCDALRLVADASLPREDVVTAVAHHDDVAIALWALALDHGATDLDAVRAAHPLMAAVSPDRQDRLVRAALVTPIRALAAGLAVALVDADGTEARRDRAARWLAFGDAPFDLVAQHLAQPR